MDTINNGYEWNDFVSSVGSWHPQRHLQRAQLSGIFYSHDNVGIASDLIKEHPFDLLLVRPYTESISGHDAARYLRRQCPGIPVLIVAGMLEDMELENREALQEFEVFPKPFKAAELLNKVKEVLIKYARKEDAKGSSA